MQACGVRCGQRRVRVSATSAWRAACVVLVWKLRRRRAGRFAPDDGRGVRASGPSLRLELVRLRLAWRRLMQRGRSSGRTAPLLPALRRSYDVSFIMETMGWAAPGAHGPAAGHAAGEAGRNDLVAGQRGERSFCRRTRRRSQARVPLRGMATCAAVHPRLPTPSSRRRTGRTLHPVQSCEGHGELIFALAADPVHRQFVSGGKDSFLQVAFLGLSGSRLMS